MTWPPPITAPYFLSPLLLSPGAQFPALYSPPLPPPPSLVLHSFSAPTTIHNSSLFLLYLSLKMPHEAPSEIQPSPTTDHLHSSSPPRLTLQFVDITYRIKLLGTKPSGLCSLTNQMLCRHSAEQQLTERTILDGITGVVAPGELLAVLGPSGSGKSTLLRILACRLPPPRHGGSVFSNGRLLTRAAARRIGYVPQDDVLYPHLTVRETLTYCALLRAVPRERVRAAVDAVMGELGLTRCAETAVRGVSGGERKRVAIGHEMMLGPSAVVVDEPTSGLDATAAGRMVATLRGMARRGRTMVASVHQPASRVFQMFDSVMLLSEGRCLYYGSGSDAADYFASVGFPLPGIFVNPADFMLDLANGVARLEYHGDPAEKAVVRQSLVSSYNRVLAPKVKAMVNASIASSVATSEAVRIGSERCGEKEARYFTRISWLSQFSILLSRSLKERRHETFNSLRVFQVLAAACLAGSMWWHSSIHDVKDRLGLLFFVSIFWGVFASFNSVFTFPQERVIFLKERASGMYSLSSYFMARMAGDLPMELILPTVFVVVIYWMASLRPELGAFLLTLAVILGYVLVAQGLGLALGAAIMDAKQASTVVTVTMLAFLLTGGFYVQKVPICLTWLKYTSFTFYCYRLLIGIQYRGNEISFYLGTSGKNDVPSSMVEEIETQASIMVSIVTLVIMLVGYRLLAYIALRRMKQ
ncbi:hypothetical protein HPP92_011132 [Vanilla planifolia]|uniref:ABC transporter domain-containing protein n=1 Tax=Vanilla planifolia TaxID=51239 RepID=A0A835RAY1_VANPL|nr:hypothetical protein HPP92_011132 [Vanilla planifolia]